MQFIISKINNESFLPLLAFKKMKKAASFIISYGKRRPYYESELQLEEFFIKNGLLEKKLFNKKQSYMININNNGFLPKSGLLICDVLSRNMIKNKEIIDVGTGAGAILAMHSAALGAKRVYAIDIDANVINQAKINVLSNRFEKVISVMKDSISYYRPPSSVDIILSNPPQMPCFINKSFHDDGGFDGRYWINEIFKFSEQYLKKEGFLLFNAFDFLGVDKCYGSEASLFELLENMGFTSIVLKRTRKVINKKSYTYRQRHCIRAVYPSFEFRKNSNDEYECDILTILSRKEH